jgi:hypothetical protein
MPKTRTNEAGFALILAILALVLLTFLGMTLAASTSTELQIATNYRWGQQALYNAELGLELAKDTLLNIDLAAVLPAARPAATMNVPPAPIFSRNGASGEATRNFENRTCDTVGHQGYGAVLDMSTLPFPFQNLNQANMQLGNYQIPGTTTLWVRRPLVYDPTSDSMIDSLDNTSLVLTAEGTAPYKQAGTNFTQQRRAVRTLEVSLSRVGSACGKGGQEGNSATGTGAETCVLTNNGLH